MGSKTQGEKLEALVRKAVENGWMHGGHGYAAPDLEEAQKIALMKNELSGWDDRYDLLCKGHTHELGSMSDILFNKDFARALFGEKRVWSEFRHATDSSVGTVRFQLTNAQYHLMQAVVSDDPIDYTYKAVFRDELA